MPRFSDEVPSDTGFGWIVGWKAFCRRFGITSTTRSRSISLNWLSEMPSWMGKEVLHGNPLGLIRT
jgi:hypothetical protein